MSILFEEYCTSHGEPEYVMIEQPDAFILFTFLYARYDRAVYFRDAIALDKTAQSGSFIEETPIPRWLWGRMSNTDQTLAEGQHKTPKVRPLHGHWQDVYQKPKFEPISNR